MKLFSISFALTMMFAGSGGAQGQETVSTDGALENVPAVVRKFHECVMRRWQPPDTLIGRENQAVELHIFRNRFGSIRRVEVAPKARLQDDAFFRSVTESAVRATLKSRCAELFPKREPQGIVLYLNPVDLSR